MSAVTERLPSMLTPAELADLDADRAKARKVFAGWLVTATVLTLAGNAAASMLDQLPPLAVRLAVHLLPPVVALIGFHAVTMLARAGAIHRARKGVAAAVRDAGPVYAAAVAGVLGIVAIAAVMSYAGLIAVARAGGLAPGLSAVWPLHLDLGIAVCSAALLVLRPISEADRRAAKRAAAARPAAAVGDAASERTVIPKPRPATSASVTATAASAKVAAPATVSAASAAPVPAAPRPAASAPVAAGVASAAHHERAAALIASGITAKAPADVVRVLQLLDGAASDRRIAAETRIDARTVARIRKADAAEAEADTASDPVPRLTAV